MEHKTVEPSILSTSAAGRVDLIFSVFGMVDAQDDITHPGAFQDARVSKVRLLDMHQTDSVLRTLGKVIGLRELARHELPSSVRLDFPEATGGQAAQVQFNLATEAGHDSFRHIEAGDIDEWSYGFDAVNPDYSKRNGVKLRNLRRVKLYEISPVLWGANPATAVTLIKSRRPSFDDMVRGIELAYVEHLRCELDAIARKR